MNQIAKFKFSELSSSDLQDILDTLDAVHAMDALMEDRHVVPGGDDISLDELGDALIEEMTARAVGADMSAGWAV